MRAAEGRDLPAATRAALERCQLALGAVLSPDLATPTRTTADIRAEIDAQIAYLAGPAVRPVAGGRPGSYSGDVGAGAGYQPPAAALTGYQSEQAPPTPFGDAADSLGSGRPVGVRPTDHD